MWICRILNCHEGATLVNPEFIAKTYTLDWDNITLDECLYRLHFIRKNHSNTKKLEYRLSPSKTGFHVRARLHGNACIPRLRMEFWDDPRRLLHDIFNRPDNIHDVLWDRKRIKGKIYEAGEWITYD